ncbi:MAG: hypothetical protein KAS32_05365 [Candidatus Peribacteraceae bacterium]|nr:hypothetical protein [Candidatus Peribacteraceae bacterium]
MILKLKLVVSDVDDNILAAEELNSDWTIELERDISSLMKKDMRGEMSNILYKQIKMAISPELIDRLLEKSGGKENENN